MLYTHRCIHIDMLLSASTSGFFAPTFRICFSWSSRGEQMYILYHNML